MRKHVHACCTEGWGAAWRIRLDMGWDMVNIGMAYIVMAYHSYGLYADAFRHGLGPCALEFRRACVASLEGGVPHGLYSYSLYSYGLYSYGVVALKGGVQHADCVLRVAVLLHRL